ncbi:hypothetical protein CP082626L3_0973A, partial [Chlamydia psittaci 08-2626_L3]
MESLFTIT